MSTASGLPALSVLFVEDEADIRLIVEMALHHEPGFRVTSFVCGEPAIAHVRSTTGTYDVALLNVMLPDMHGTVLAERLREAAAMRGATFLFVTALVPPGGIEAYRAMGVDGVILKPFDVLTLAGTIRAAHEAAGGRGRAQAVAPE